MGRFDRNGVGLRYEASGVGRPVVLHTGGGGDSDMFVSAGYVDALVGSGYQVICFDHRGHGRSDKPLTRPQHATREYVEDVVGLLDTLDLPTAAIIGYSQTGPPQPPGIAEPEPVASSSRNRELGSS